VKELEDNKDVIKSDLDKLATLLVKYAVCEDPSPIHKAIGAAYKSDEQYWSYKISDLKFQLEKHPHTIPHSADLLELVFSIDAKGLYATSTLLNPFLHIELNIEITGYDEDCLPLLASWHLDKHIQEGDEETKYIHPEYHMTYGGRKMWDSNLAFGSSLVFPTPRFIHAPLDAFLGIDFVLGNYLHKTKIKRLINDPEYIKIMARSQIRVWRPFYSSIANHWNRHFSAEECFNCFSLIPNIIAHR
jgi:hypothetical protein